MDISDSLFMCRVHCNVKQTLMLPAIVVLLGVHALISIHVHSFNHKITVMWMNKSIKSSQFTLACFTPAEINLNVT